MSFNPECSFLNSQPFFAVHTVKAIFARKSESRLISKKDKDGTVVCVCMYVCVRVCKSVCKRGGGERGELRLRWDGNGSTIKASEAGTLRSGTQTTAKAAKARLLIWCQCPLMLLRTLFPSLTSCKWLLKGQKRRERS